MAAAHVGSVRQMLARWRHVIVIRASHDARVEATGSLCLKQVANRVVASGIVSSPLEESPGSNGYAARQHLGVTGFGRTDDGQCNRKHTADGARGNSNERARVKR